MESLLLSAVSGHFSGTERLSSVCPPKDAGEWVQLRRISKEQQVLPIVWDAIRAAGWLPDSLCPADDGDPACGCMTYREYVRWKLSVDKAAVGYIYKQEVLSELMEFLTGEGFDCMELKGVTIAGMYPVPPFRVFNDLDIYVASDFERAEQALVEKFGCQVLRGYAHHDKLRVGDVIVELHRNFINLHKHTSHRILEKELKRLYAEDRATFMLCFVFHHTAIHFVNAGLPLKMLLDLTAVLRHFAGQIDFDAVHSICCRCGSERFYDVVIRFMEKYLGFDASLGGPWAGSVSGELLDRVYDSMFNPPYRAGTRNAAGVLRLTGWFFAGRWKHNLVYANESLTGVFLRTVRFRFYRKLRKVCNQ